MLANRIDDAQLLDDNKPLEGWRLVGMLLDKARQENIGVNAVAGRIGISESYWHSLRYGQRKISSLGRETVER